MNETDAAGKAAPISGRVPTLAPRQAAALQGVFGTARRWYLGDGGELVLTPGEAPESGATFAVEGGGGTLAVAFEGAGPAASTDGLQWSDFEGRSRTLAWSLAHESRLVRLSEALGLSLVPVLANGAPGDLAATEDALWFRFRIEDPEIEGASPPIPCRGHIQLPVLRLQELLARAGHPYGEDPPAPLAAWPALPVPVRLRFPGPQVRMEEWRTLQPGAVIVVGRASAPPGVLACAAGKAWPVVPAPGGWRVDGTPQTDTTTQENSMSEATEAAASAPAEEDTTDSAVRDLPVRVQFELGQAELSVGELAALQPGYVFSLPSHLQGANVTIRANGRDVGRGEVVAVGDTLGVRLLAWS